MSITITAADVNKLRQQTGAGIMDCRAALQETNGDFEAAIDFLRKKGQKVAAKRSDRDAKEGVVVAKTSNDGKYGIVLNLTSETDFVAKNEDFVNLALSFSQTAVDNNVPDLETFKSTQMNGISVQDKIMETVSKIGEKIDITSLDRLNSECVVAYNHAGYRVAVLVALNQPMGDAIVQAGKDVAMQIAAMNPIAVDPAAVPAATIDREKAIIIEQMKADPKMTGKTEDMLSKIADGKINAYFKENTLLAQPFVKDGSKTVAEYLKSINNDLTVTAFSRLNIG
ncbi:MAG: elongation factor Ts [Chitinophagaceae bacterium]|nr:MAG: elongation factor Ts [Bacteroidetes bacterium OLB11]MCC6447583.1 elongation factor Ts [Chitinophagaceae bacterium]HMN33571.1 translation elongation factor Ts [Chitinophagaceae bacterium]